MLENIKVLVRLRPDEPSEGTPCIIHHDSHSLQVEPDSKDQESNIRGGKIEPKRFHFDKVFGPESSQDDVYREVDPLVESALNGYNATIFAYGSTGSGKTHTISGPFGMDFYSNTEERISLSGGIIPRAISRIFELAQNLTQRESETLVLVHMGYVELYNNQFRDLLKSEHMDGSNSNNNKIELHSNLGGNVFLTGSETLRIPVTSAQQALRLVSIGMKNRITGKTDCNEHSSRSHSILTFHIESRSSLVQKSQQLTKLGKIHLVDLAGSERLSLSGVVGGEALAETKNINLSLSTLGDVLSALSKLHSHHKQSKLTNSNNNKNTIPYRNSKLTYLLKDSLGGNSKTVMIATIRTPNTYRQQTLMTLMYASRAKKIQNSISINTDTSGNSKASALVAEVARLKDQLRKREMDFERLSKQIPDKKDAAGEKKRLEKLVLLSRENELEKKSLEDCLKQVVHNHTSTIAAQQLKFNDLQGKLIEYKDVFNKQKMEIETLRDSIKLLGKGATEEEVKEMKRIVEKLAKSLAEARQELKMKDSSLEAVQLEKKFVLENMTNKYDKLARDYDLLKKASTEALHKVENARETEISLRNRVKKMQEQPCESCNEIKSRYHTAIGELQDQVKVLLSVRDGDMEKAREIIKKKTDENEQLTTQVEKFNTNILEMKTENEKLLMEIDRINQESRNQEHQHQEDREKLQQRIELLVNEKSKWEVEHASTEGDLRRMQNKIDLLEKENSNVENLKLDELSILQNKIELLENENSKWKVDFSNAEKLKLDEISILQSKINLLEKENSKWKVQFSKKENSKLEKLSELQSKINLLEKENSKCKVDFSNLEKQKLEELSKMQNKLNLLEKEHSKWKVDFSNNRNVSKELETLKKEHQAKKEELQVNENEISILKNELRKKDVQLDKTNSELKILQGKYSEYELDFKERISSLEKLTVEQKQQYLGKYEQLENTLKQRETVFQQYKDDSKALIKHLKQKLANETEKWQKALADEKTKSLNSSEEYRKCFDENEKLTKELNQLRCDFKTQTEQIQQRNDKMIVKLESEINRFQKETTSLEEEKETIEVKYQDQMSKANNEIQILRGKLHDVLNDVEIGEASERLKYENELKQALETQKTSFENKIESLNEKLTESSVCQNTLKKTIVRLEKTLQEQRESSKRQIKQLEDARAEVSMEMTEQLGAVTKDRNALVESFNELKKQISMHEDVEKQVEILKSQLIDELKLQKHDDDAADDDDDDDDDDIMARNPHMSIVDVFQLYKERRVNKIIFSLESNLVEQNEKVIKLENDVDKFKKYILLQTKDVKKVLLDGVEAMYSRMDLLVGENVKSIQTLETRLNNVNSKFEGLNKIFRKKNSMQQKLKLNKKHAFKAAAENHQKEISVEFATIRADQEKLLLNHQSKTLKFNKKHQTFNNHSTNQNATVYGGYKLTILNACLKGDPKALEKALAINFLENDFQPDDCSFLPYHRAISGFHFHGQIMNVLRLLEILNDHGAPVNIRDTAGNTVLHKAIQVIPSKDVLVIVKCLVKVLKVDVNIKNKLDDTALHTEIRRLRNNSDKIAKVLVEDGNADLTIESHGHTPLQLVENIASQADLTLRESDFFTNIIEYLSLCETKKIIG